MTRRRLPHFADLRDGGNLPREPLGLRWLALFAALSVTLTTALIIADKAVGHTAALTCGAC